MKSLVLIVIVVLAMVAIGCARTSQLQPHEPRYTADQVIAVVQAQYPACFEPEVAPVVPPTDSLGFGNMVYREVSESPSISVNYIGGSTSVWKVTVNCPRGYKFKDGTSSKALHFYESDGSLREY